MEKIKDGPGEETINVKPPSIGEKSVEAETLGSENAAASQMDAVLQRQINDKLKGKQNGKSPVAASSEESKPAMKRAVVKETPAVKEAPVETPAAEATPVEAPAAEAAPVEAPAAAEAPAPAEAPAADATPVEAPAAEAAPAEAPAVEATPVEAPAAEAAPAEAPAADATPGEAPAAEAITSVEKPANPIAEKMAELSGLADHFTDLARSPVQSAEAASKHEEESPKVDLNMTKKDPYVAAAEKERVLKMIRDAASKRMEDGFDLRATLRARMAPLEDAPAPTESPVALEEAPSATDAPEGTAATGFTIQEDVTTTVAPEAPSEPEESAAVVEEPAAPVAAIQPMEPEAPAATEATKPSQTAVLLPPSMKMPSGTRMKMDPLPSPSQARLTEAFLRQLKGHEPMPEGLEIKKTRAKVTTDDAAPQPEVAPTARPRKRTRRNIAEDGSIEVPVESLGSGIFNALGDMVGAVVEGSAATARKVQSTVTGEDPMPEAPGPKLSGTDRAARRIAKGVKGAGSGAAEIVVGAGNIVVGAVGIVTMPVLGAIGSVFQAFKPAKE
ncbi:MAG: hypothetical protein HQM04_13895 [Magnetococcales bacterium]|nr:hypothetical protein [Magnetococcales bacterium]